MTDRLHVYKDKTGFWRWNLVAPNGNIIADSGESYRHRGDLLAITDTRFPDVDVIEDP